MNTEKLIKDEKELSNIKRLLNDIRRIGKGGTLYVDGQAYKVVHLCKVEDLD